MAIVLLLSSPNPNDPLNFEAGKLLREDKAQYFKTVMEWITNNAK